MLCAVDQQKLNYSEAKFSRLIKKLECYLQTKWSLVAYQYWFAGILLTWASLSCLRNFSEFGFHCETQRSDKNLNSLRSSKKSASN